MPISDEIKPLNGPMVKRIQRCAADTSSDWAGKITIFPPEARQLAELVDDVESLRGVWLTALAYYRSGGDVDDHNALMEAVQSHLECRVNRPYYSEGGEAR